MFYEKLFNTLTSLFLLLNTTICLGQHIYLFGLGECLLLTIFFSLKDLSDTLVDQDLKRPSEQDSHRQSQG